MNDIFTVSHMLRAIDMQNECRNKIYCKSIAVHNRNVERELCNGTTTTFVQWVKSCTNKGSKVVHDVIDFVKFVYQKDSHNIIYKNVVKKFGQDVADDLFLDEEQFDKNFKTRESEKMFLEESARMFTCNPHDQDSPSTFKEKRTVRPVYGKLDNLPDVSYKKAVTQGSTDSEQSDRVTQLEQQVTSLTNEKHQIEDKMKTTITQEIATQLKPISETITQNDKKQIERVDAVLTEVDEKWKNFKEYSKRKDKKHKSAMKALIQANHQQYLDSLKNLNAPSAASNSAPGVNK